MKCQNLFSGKNKKNIISVLFAQRVVLFVCVEVLLPSQPSRVMLRMVSLPNHTFLGLAYSFKLVIGTCAHSFSSSWQLPLNQQKGENDHRKYFVINLHRRMLPDPVGFELATHYENTPIQIYWKFYHVFVMFWCASDWATEAAFPEW